ncbi:MAG TPA: hypothetical protein VG317_17595 [Pseudonocardiaceae bacterium]|jgi:hypothetical protein|nr:hypothetical protein [Pseudonocardiaceae bacterium]
MANYPVLGFDPAPGEPSAVTALGTTFSTVAQHLGSARDTLNDIGNSDSVWQGDAANNFRGKVGQLPDYLGKANASLSDAARALDGWASDLTTMQQQAAGYESQAEQALQKLQQAQSNPNLKLAGQHFDNQQALQQAQGELNAAEQSLNSAQQELDSIRADAKRLQSQHDDLAHQIADALRRAKDEAPPEPGWLDSLGDALGGLLNDVKSLAGKVWQWTKDHAADIAKVGDILSKIGGVLAIVAAATSWIPVVGEVTAAAALGVNAAALAAHGLAKLAGDKDVGWGTLATDALGLIPGGKGATALKMVTDGAGDLGKSALTIAKDAIQDGGMKTVISGTKDAVSDFKGVVKDAFDSKALQKFATTQYNEQARNLYNVTSTLGLKPMAQNTVQGAFAIAGYDAAKQIAVDQTISAGVDQVKGHFGDTAGSAADHAGGLASSSGEDILQKGIGKGAAVFHNMMIPKG